MFSVHSHAKLIIAWEDLRAELVRLHSTRLHLPGLDMEQATSSELADALGKLLGEEEWGEAGAAPRIQQ